MSLNNSLNAVIALIENRPEVAKEIFRSPSSDVKNIGEATARLYTALDKYLAHKLRTLLVNSLAIQAPFGDDVVRNVVRDEAFVEGVRAVETMIEEYVRDLES